MYRRRNREAGSSRYVKFPKQSDKPVVVAPPAVAHITTKNNQELLKPHKSTSSFWPRGAQRGP